MNGERIDFAKETEGFGIERGRKNQRQEKKEKFFFTTSGKLGHFAGLYIQRVNFFLCLFPYRGFNGTVILYPIEYGKIKYQDKSDFKKFPGEECKRMQTSASRTTSQPSGKRNGFFQRKLRKLRNLRSQSLIRNAYWWQRVVSLILMTCLLSSTVFAAPNASQMITGTFRGIQQDIRFSLMSANFGANLFSFETLALFLKPFSGKKKQQGPERIVILPRGNGENGELTVMQGEKINFTAVGLGRDDQPLSGLPFKWTIQDTYRNRPARPLNNGTFTASTHGTFLVTAETLGRQGQITVTVKPNEGYLLQKTLLKTEPERSEREKQSLGELKNKGAIVSREISSKNNYRAEEEAKLNEIDKQKQNQARDQTI